MTTLSPVVEINFPARGDVYRIPAGLVRQTLPHSLILGAFDPLDFDAPRASSERTELLAALVAASLVMLLSDSPGANLVYAQKIAAQGAVPDYALSARRSYIEQRCARLPIARLFAEGEARTLDDFCSNLVPRFLSALCDDSNDAQWEAGTLKFQSWALDWLGEDWRRLAHPMLDYRWEHDSVRVIAAFRALEKQYSHSDIASAIAPHIIPLVEKYNFLH